MRDIFLAVSTTSLVFVSVALAAFVTGKIQLQPIDPYQVMAAAEAPLKKAK